MYIVLHDLLHQTNHPTKPRGGITQGNAYIEKPLNSSKSRCLAGEPRHFPLAIVFVLIIERPLTCTFGWKKAIFWWFFWRFWLIFGNLRPKNYRALLRRLKHIVRWSPLQFIWQNFSSTKNISTVIYKKSKKRKNAENIQFCQVWAQISRLKDFPQTSSLWQLIEIRSSFIFFFE